MKHLSLKIKITLWFSTLIIIIVAIMFALMFMISGSVLKSDIKEQLVTLVETNAEEIEYYSNIETEEREKGDQYIQYNGGYIEIDDDFLDQFNGIYTALHDPQGELLYGESVVESPITTFDKVETVTEGREKYFVYCCELSGKNLDGLVLRGTVSEYANLTLLSRIMSLSMLLLPFLALIAIIGGYRIAQRSLKPIVKIAQAAEAINDGGDLSKRIELGDGGDEVHMLADTFNKMFGRLEKSFEDERQFTSDISHELRTPVTVVLAQSELTLEQERTPQEYKKALEVIKRQALRMKTTVEEMLTFSRLDRMTELADIKKINLSELVKELVEEQATIKKKDITLHGDIQSNIYIDADRHLIERMITNLIANAYRYGNENGNIYVKLKAEKQQICLSVADDGVGIAENELDKIWNRFYQVDTSRTSGQKNNGVGLGLPMVQRIAALHGGKIEVESKLGEGSRFIFIMPQKN